MKRILTNLPFLFLALFTFSSQLTALPLSNCYVADFTAGDNNADACFLGNSSNDSLTDVNNLDLTPFASGGWSKGAKWEEDSGLEGGFGPLTSFTIWPMDGNGFNWSLSSEELATFSDALFVVKQGNPNSNNPGGWVAYLFEDLSDNSGEYYTQNSFDVNDYSHVSLYTRGEGSISTGVPEIDAGSAGLAIGLLIAFVLLVRERRNRFVQPAH